jgi:hypothetical protein
LWHGADAARDRGIETQCAQRGSEAGKGEIWVMMRVVLNHSAVIPAERSESRDP